MHIALFIFYGIVGGYAITRLRFFRNSRIKPTILILLFGLRVVTGCLHNMIAYRYYPNHGDVWRFFNHSLVTRQELFTDFHAFWADNSVWAYMAHNVIEWMLVIFNFFSFDNLYIDTLLFSFFTLAGSLALFRVFIRWFPGDLLSAGCVFLLPSTLFWTSCIHTEGILYTILGFFFFILDRLIINRRTTVDPSADVNHPIAVNRPTADTFPTVRSQLAVGTPLLNGRSARPILLCLCLFVLAVFFRPAILLGLLPATLYLAGSKVASRNRLFLLAGAAVVLLLLFIPGLSSPILQYLSNRQQEFQVLTGNSRIYLPVLEPTWSSLGQVLPRAFLNGFFQPWPGSGGQTIYLVFAGELLLIWLIIVMALSQLFFRRFSLSSFGTSNLLFSILGMLLIGYMIPFVGSVIRYRSIYLPFLLAPFLHTLRHFQIHKKISTYLKVMLD